MSVVLSSRNVRSVPLLFFQTFDAEDLYLVMPMYNLTEYSSNYFEKTESLWLFSNDEATNLNNAIADDDHSNHSSVKLN